MGKLEAKFKDSCSPRDLQEPQAGSSTYYLLEPKVLHYDAILEVMKLLSTLLFLLPLSTASPHNKPDHHGSRKGCLTQKDVDYILSRWPRIFDTGPAGNDLIPTTVSEDFQAFDEGLLFGNVTSDEPFLRSREEFIADRKIRAAGEQPGQFESVIDFHSCHQIAWRFQFKGVTNGDRWLITSLPLLWRIEANMCFVQSNTGTLAPAGQPIRFKGIDMLYIKPGTLLIEKLYGASVGRPQLNSLDHK